QQRRQQSQESASLTLPFRLGRLRQHYLEGRAGCGFAHGIAFLFLHEDASIGIVACATAGEQSEDNGVPGFRAKSGSPSVTTSAAPRGCWPGGGRGCSRPAR